MFKPDSINTSIKPIRVSSSDKYRRATSVKQIENAALLRVGQCVAGQQFILEILQVFLTSTVSDMSCKGVCWRQ
jgi:ribose 5-phosphate isomerase RpiB